MIKKQTLLFFLHCFMLSFAYPAGHLLAGDFLSGSKTLDTTEKVPNELWFHIIEQGLPSQINTTQNLHEARNLLSCFGKVNRHFRLIANDHFISALLANKISKEGILALWKSIKNNKDNNNKIQDVALLCNALRSLQSQEVTKFIFDQINHAYSGGFHFSNDAQINHSISRDIILTLEELAPKLNLSTELKQAYRKLFLKYYENYLSLNSNIDILDCIEKLFPHYVNIDPSGAVEMLTAFLEHDLEYGWREAYLLRFLRLLPEPHRSEYTLKLEQSSCSPGIIEVLCKDQDLAQSFNGTLLDWNILAQNAFLSFKTENGSTKNLISFFEHGGPLFYQQYENEIIAILPLFLQKSLGDYRLVITMATQFDRQRLQKAALQALVERTSTNEKNSLVSYILRELFANITNFNAQEKTSLYLLMNTIYQEKKSIEALQYLWMHLHTQGETFKELLHSSVLQYFSVRPESVNEENLDSFCTFFNKALRISNAQQTLSFDQFKETLNIAHETQLASIIDPAFLATAKTAVIFNEQASFEERATFLDQQLLTMEPFEMGKFFVTLNNRVVDNEFKEYINNILTVLRVDSTSFEICAAKKRLQEIHTKYHLLHALPDIVRKVSGNLPNFSSYEFQHAKKPRRFIELNGDLKKAQFGNNGLIYGLSGVKYQGEDSSLAAIDETTLDLIWEVPIQNPETVFTFDTTLLYLQDGSDVICLDKKTGVEKARYSLPDKLPIIFLAVDKEGFLLVVQSLKLDSFSPHCCENKITVINQSDRTASVLENATETGGKNYFVTDTAFGYYYSPDHTIVLYPKNQPKQIIQTHFTKFYDSQVFTKNNLLFFIRAIQNSFQLVCFDTSTLTEKWSYQLENKLSANPCFTEDGKIMFLASKKTITALQLNENQVNKLWECTLKTNNNIFKLVVSPDNQSLFCSPEYHKEVYIINIKDGTLLTTIECESSQRHYTLLGISQKGIPILD